jgi:hypothetical protein
LFAADLRAAEKVRTGKSILVAIILDVLPLCPAQTWPLDPPTSITKVEVPVYVKLNPEPVAVFRAERFVDEYQTKGFFRIGALPLTVAEDLSVELKDPSRLPVALSALGVRFALKDAGKRAVEGRNFTLSFSGEKHGRLQARCVRMEGPTEWTMEEGSVSLPNAAPAHFHRGLLVLDGPEAGWIKYQGTNGVMQVHLFALYAN